MTRFAAGAAVLLVACASAFADGGAVQLRQRAGPFYVTLFSSPVPLRPGTADFSVLVENAADHTPVLSAAVELRIGDTAVTATREQATNKLLYAAQVMLDRPGRVPIALHIRDASGAADITGDVLVEREAPPLAVYWPYFGIVPAAILLFALNQSLKRRRRLRNPPAPPSQRFVR